jgi:hypothetical protein
MTRDEAIELGTQFMLQKVGPNPRYLGEDCDYRLIGARLAGDGTWSVLFQTHLLGPPPSIVDGPIVVVVDPKSGTASFL